MFVHENQLRHVLPPAAYYTEDQHHRELERALLPGWHFVASMGDLRRDGDFVTLTLFGRPLLARRIGGEAHAYLNVCGHRHCMLTSRPRVTVPGSRFSSTSPSDHAAHTSAAMVSEVAKTSIMKSPEG